MVLRARSHYDASSHTLTTIERLGPESGKWIAVIRTETT